MTVAVGKSYKGRRYGFHVTVVEVTPDEHVIYRYGEGHTGVMKLTSFERAYEVPS